MAAAPALAVEEAASGPAVDGAPQGGLATARELKPAQVDDPSAVWRAAVSEVKAGKKEMLASAMAHARLLSVSPGRVRIGFGPSGGLFRRQVERMLRDVEAAVSKVLGTPSALVVEQVTDDEGEQSLAEQDNERVKAREERILRESREHPAVQAALRALRGTVEHVRILEDLGEPQEPEPSAEEVDEPDA